MNYCSSIFNLVSRSFPSYLRVNIKIISCLLISQRIHRGGAPIVGKEIVSLVLDDEIVRMPDRVYFHDIPEPFLKLLSKTQRTMIMCIYSRSCNGYTRQKSVEWIMEQDSIPLWAIPYIVKLCDEYVIEILESIYLRMTRVDLSLILKFINDNKNFLCRGYDRMVSYWNCYYREKYPEIKRYTGYRIFKDIFNSY